MILSRYLFVQLLPPFFFSLFLFSGVLLMDKVFDLIDLLVNKGVALSLAGHMFLLFIPTVMTLSVPMSILLACLLTFGRLSEDNEITALRASGLSFTQILWPPAVFALLLSAALVPFNAVLAPKAINSFRAIYHRIVTADPLIKIEPRQFLALQNIKLFAHELTPDRSVMRRVWLYQNGADTTQRVFAQEGTAQVNEERLSLRLKNGQIERFANGAPRDLTHIQFEEYTLTVPFNTRVSERDQSYREMSVGTLKEAIKKQREMNLPASEPEAELHLRFAIAFAPLALAFLGIPLGIALERGGRGVGFGASVAVLFGYYLLLIAGLNLAEKGALPALPALWMANVFTLTLGVILGWRRLFR